MAVDKATEVLIILVVIIVVMLIFLILTVVVLVLRWRRYNTRDSALTYSYSIPTKSTRFPHARNSEHELYSYVSPNIFSDPISPSGVSADKYETYRTEEGNTHLHVSPRISAISGTSVDMGNLRDISEFSRNPGARQLSHQRMDRHSAGQKVDSMRSSTGVDLGGNYNKAWKIVSSDQWFNL